MPARLTLAALLLAASCADRPTDADLDVAAALAQGMAEACPIVHSSDEAARDACAAGLTSLAALRENMTAPFFWGGQKPGTEGYASSHRTRFDPLVFRRMYLSTFMFDGQYSVEKGADGVTTIRFPARFRNEMDPGAFPYPFWHSADKWKSYQLATHVLFFVQDGKLVGGLRSAEQDASRPRRERQFDGAWTWTQEGAQEPHVSLYTYLFSAQNPQRGKLEAAYRALESELRSDSCMSCHSPDNTTAMNPLWLLNYPNQALTARHEIVDVLESNRMPPPNTLNIAVGLSAERRAELLPLARAFAQLGDDALIAEGQYLP